MVINHLYVMWGNLEFQNKNLHIKLHDSFWFHRLYFFNVILQQMFYLYRTSRIQIQRINKNYNNKHHKLGMISQFLCSIGRKIKSIELYEWLGLNINQYSCCYVINYFANNAWLICSPNYMNLNISYYMIQWLPDNYKAPIVSYDINHKMFINNS